MGINPFKEHKNVSIIYSILDLLPSLKYVNGSWIPSPHPTQSIGPRVAHYADLGILNADLPPAPPDDAMT
jgi:hypothetical protein